MNGTNIYQMTSITEPIFIGRTGENEFRTFEFDVLEWKKQYPNGTLSAVYRRPDDATYPVLISEKEGVAVWTVTATETAFFGFAELELRIEDGDKIGKSVRVPLYVEAALETGDTPPAPMGEWFRAIMEEIAEADEEIKVLLAQKPQIAQNTQDIADLQSYILDNDDNILGLEVDFENKLYTRLSGAKNLKPGEDFDKYNMYGGRKRCNVRDTGHATITAFYGDENYRDNGTNGQVMVYQPKFYYMVVPLKLEPQASGKGYHLRKVRYYISDRPRTGFKVHPVFYNRLGKEVDYVLYSAYEGSYWLSPSCVPGAYVDDSVDTSTETWHWIASVADAKPISGKHKNLTRSVFQELSKYRNPDWGIEPIKATCANQLLMMIEAGTTSLQARLGCYGHFEPSFNVEGAWEENHARNTGGTISLGNKTGSVNYAISYRGIENPWGNIFKHINGINIKHDTAASSSVYIANDYNFKDAKYDDNYEDAGFSIPRSTDGYISAFGYGNEKFDWLFAPSEVAGNSALPVGDYMYTDHDSRPGLTNTTPDLGVGVAVGGYIFTGVGQGGPFCAIYNKWCGKDATNAYIGARLFYAPSVVL